MIKSPIVLSAIISLSASLFVTGNALADDDYDVKAHGPKSSIVWNTPVIATFDHKTHTMDAGLECSSCHDDIFVMQRGTAVNTKKFTMQAMAEGEFCGTCHDGDTAFATDTNCMSCHGASEEPIMWEKPTKAAFSHTQHVEEFELECSSCHSTVFAMKKGAATASGDFTMAAFAEGKYCGSCHNGDDAFVASSQCESCHFPPTEKIVFNEPVKSVIFDHEIHVVREELSCESCHKDVFIMEQGHVADSKLASSDDPQVKREYLEQLHTKFCGTCHDSDQAFGYQTRCTVCHIGLKGFNRMNGGDTKSDGHGKSGH